MSDLRGDIMHCHRRDFLRLAGTTALIPSLASARTPKRMNVLMIAVDDMNNWIGALSGPAKTPNIDRLARQGVLFTNSYCVYPACNPSRTALMTGQRPETTGQFTNEGNFRDKPGGRERVTLPQYLQRFGYETAAAGKIFHHPRGSGGVPNPLSDPVSWNRQRRGGIGTPGAKRYLNKDGLARWHDGAIKGYLGRSGIWGPIAEPTEQTGDWRTAEYCARYLKERHEMPFFLACGIFRPHAPLLAPQKYFDMNPLSEVKTPHVPDDDMDDVPKIAKTNFSTPFVRKVREKGQWQKAVRGYLACMAFADACVGRVLDALEAGGQRDNTIVIFWTDHGWQLGHKWRWEKYSLWKQGTQSPLIVRVPGMATAGQACDRAVSFLDLYPTVAELLNIPKPDFVEGASLVPWLKDPSRPRDIPAVITYPQGSHSVVHDHWNYIHYRDGSEELYDHRTDPDEFHNLAGDPQHATLKQRLARWIPKPYNPPDP